MYMWSPFKALVLYQNLSFRFYVRACRAGWSSSSPRICSTSFVCEELDAFVWVPLNKPNKIKTNQNVPSSWATVGKEALHLWLAAVCSSMPQATLTLCKNYSSWSIGLFTVVHMGGDLNVTHCEAHFGPWTKDLKFASFNVNRFVLVRLHLFSKRWHRKMINLPEASPEKNKVWWTAKTEIAIRWSDHTIRRSLKKEH